MRKLRGESSLALSNTGSPRITDFPSNLANLIRNEYSAHTLKIGFGQSSRSLPQARKIVGSGDENVPKRDYVHSNTVSSFLIPIAVVIVTLEVRFQLSID